MMRLLKLFGLTALAVMATMAVAGVSSAAAEVTVLCTENVTPCPEASIPAQGVHSEGTGTVIKAVAKNPILKVYKTAEQKEIENEITCEKSTIEGRYQEKGTQEHPQHKGQITSQVTTGCGIRGVAGATCHSPGSAAGEIRGIQLSYRTLLTWTVNQNGQLIVYEQSPNGQPGTSVECAVFGVPVLNCTYKVAETDSQVTEEIGGTGQNAAHFEVKAFEEPKAGEPIPAKVIANQVEVKFEGPNCKGAQKAKLDATYEVTEPNNGKLWVSKQSP